MRVSQGDSRHGPRSRVRVAGTRLQSRSYQRAAVRVRADETFEREKWRNRGYFFGLLALDQNLSSVTYRAKFRIRMRLPWHASQPIFVGLARRGVVRCVGLLEPGRGAPETQHRSRVASRDLYNLIQALTKALSKALG